MDAIRHEPAIATPSDVVGVARKALAEGIVAHNGLDDWWTGTVTTSGRLYYNVFHANIAIENKNNTRMGVAIKEFRSEKGLLRSNNALLNSDNIIPIAQAIAIASHLFPEKWSATKNARMANMTGI